MVNKKENTLDKEQKAMLEIIGILNRVSEEARKRILNSVRVFYGIGTLGDY